MTTIESAPTHSSTPSDPAVHRRRWWILGVLCLSLLIVFIGNSSLNVTLPTLSRELGATEAQLQWVVAIYSLVFAGLLFTTGALGDRYGRKGALQLGLLLFLGGCIAASFADVMWQLIACRAVMGVGAAMIMPSTLSILVNVFPPDERTKAIAIWASVTGAAGALGPVASGYLLDHFWFGSVFLVNVPVVALAFAAGIWLLPRSKDPEHGVLDPVGAVLSIIGICAVVYALIEAPDAGWLSASTMAGFAVGAVALVLFVAWELRVDEPMLDIRFFANPAFSTGTGGMVLVFMAMYGTMFLTSQYFQLVVGYSAFDAAVRLLPMAPIMAVVAPQTPRLSARIGANRTVAAGMALIAVGFAMIAQVGAATSYAYILASIAALTTGMALAMSPMTAAIMSAVPARRAGSGSAMNDASREVGAALGIAVLGSVAASQFGSGLDTLTAGLPDAAREQASASLAGALQVAARLPGEAGAALRAGAEGAFLDGYSVAALTGAVIAALAAVLVWRFLPRHLAHGGAVDDAVDALDDAAEPGIAGVPPVLPDEVFPGDLPPIVPVAPPMPR